MTDVAGTGEPAGSDPLGEMPLDAEPVADTAEPHSLDHDHHVDGGHHHLHGDGHIGNAVRGLLGRGDKGQ